MPSMERCKEYAFAVDLLEWIVHLCMFALITANPCPGPTALPGDPWLKEGLVAEMSTVSSGRYGVIKSQRMPIVPMPAFFYP